MQSGSFNIKLVDDSKKFVLGVRMVNGKGNVLFVCESNFYGVQVDVVDYSYLRCLTRIFEVQQLDEPPAPLSLYLNGDLYGRIFSHRIFASEVSYEGYLLLSEGPSSGVPVYRSLFICEVIGHLIRTYARVNTAHLN